MNPSIIGLRWGIVLSALAVLTACGGGGGGGPGSPPPPGSNDGYTPGVFQPSSAFKNQCAAVSQKNYLRSWTNELYLWFSEVPDLNPSTLSVDDYFDQLKTPATTASGRPRDRFHFLLDTDVYEALSQSGIEPGYGAQLMILADRPPRRVVVAYVQAGSAAANLNIGRGAEIVAADGVSVINGNTQGAVDTINAALFPAAAGESHTFTIRESGVDRTVMLTSANVTYAPVPTVQVLPVAGQQVGYILFNDHIATSEEALIGAISTLQAAGVDDLVLDVRYNGGGFLAIASELAYMIGGSNTVGRTFERLVFNSKHTSTDPVTGRPLTPMPFLSTRQGVDGGPRGTPLPTLNLSRVYVITGGNTCSASESIMNGLRGANVDVYQIGSTTCGKPFGFYPQDNCGTTYFSIQFQGLNDAGFGDYPDGFTPSNTSGTQGVELPGCSVADDFTRPLGDVNEARLAATLSFRASNHQSCPAASGFAPGTLTKPGQSLQAADGVMYRSPARENRIMGTP